MFNNDYDVSTIKMSNKVHCYCTLGEELYTGNIVIVVKNPRSIPDYCDVHNYINSLDGKNLIIEELAKDVKDYVKSQIEDGTVTVSVYVDDAPKHMPVEVVVND